jgi:flagellar export protein FliJ
MSGLEALLRVKRLAEDKAGKELGRAQRHMEEIRREERALGERFQEAKGALRRLEQGKFGVRQSLIYRRYLNAVRGRIERVRKRAADTAAVVEEKRKAYEQSLNEREAVGELIKRRRERAGKVRRRREERVIGDLAQNAWARDAAEAGRS